MTRIKIPIRYADTETDVSLSTIYSTAQVIDLKQPPVFSDSAQPFQHELEYIYISLKSISSATKVTFKITSDADGDDTVIAATELTIETGITTTTVGSVSAKIDVPIYLPSDVVYLWCKTDAGSATMDRSQITWSE